MRSYSVYFFAVMMVSFCGWSSAEDVSARGDAATPMTDSPTVVEDMRSPFEVNDSFAEETSPTAIKIRESVSAKTINLQGIAIGPLKRMAVISGQTYVEGESKENLELVSVRKSEVDVKQGASALTLKMNEIDEPEKKAKSQSSNVRDDESIPAIPGIPRMNY